MQMNEEFFRCPGCNNAYFEMKEYYLIEKDMDETYNYDEEEPIVLEVKRKLVCSDCGKISTKRELINYVK